MKTGEPIWPWSLCLCPRGIGRQGLPFCRSGVKDKAVKTAEKGYHIERNLAISHEKSGLKINNPAICLR